MTDHPSHRAAPPPKTPPAEVIAEAIKISRTYRANRYLHPVSESEARRILHVYWPQYIADLVRRGAERHWLTSWRNGFQAHLEREHAARDLHRARREKWEERQRQIADQYYRRDPAYRGAAREKIFAAEAARQAQADKTLAVRAKYNTPEKIAARLAQKKADDQG